MYVCVVYVCMHTLEARGLMFNVYHSVYSFEIRSLNSAALAGHWTLQTYLSPINSWERTYRYIHSLRNWPEASRGCQIAWSYTVTGPCELISPGSSSSFLCECCGLSQTQFLWLIRQALYGVNHLPGPLIPSFRSFVKVWSVSLHGCFCYSWFWQTSCYDIWKLWLTLAVYSSVGDSCWVWRPTVNVCKSRRADTLRIDRRNVHIVVRTQDTSVWQDKWLPPGLILKEWYWFLVGCGWVLSVVRVFVV